MQVLENLIYPVLDDLMETLYENVTIEKSPDTKLFGPESPLDSMGIVNLAVGLEEKIEEEYDVSVSLTDEKAMSRKTSPFRTIGTLAEFVEEQIKEAQRNG